MITSVILTKSVQEHILRYCSEKKPQEACGFLLGFIEAESLYAIEYLPVSNLAEDPEANFSMNPREMLPIILNASAQRKSVVGILHSHPAAAAVPSAKDLQSAWHHIPSHWIVSLQRDPEYDIQVYRYLKTSRPPSQKKVSYTSSYTPIPLTIKDD